jgi:hypothetical protein
MGLNTVLLVTDEAKATKLFKKMKTGVHMTGYRQGESHPFHWSNTARHWRGKGSTSVWVDEDWRTHDWASTRQKSSSSSTHPVHIRRGDSTVMIGLRQYKSHFMHSTHLHMSNTLHEDMMTIMRSLIEGFLQTRSVDVINRASFSCKAPRIGKPCNLWS